MANCKKKHEVKQVGYKSLENKVDNGNAERLSMISAAVGMIVIRYLNEKKKSLCFKKACGFQGKAMRRLHVKMDVNNLL